PPALYPLSLHDALPIFIDGVLCCLFVGGHALLEGVPGLGKTALIRALADALSLKFSRIRFTPDLMPADITGTNIIQETEQGGRQDRKSTRLNSSHDQIS